MTVEEKLSLFIEAIEADAGTIKPETRLEDIEEWDSLATLSLLALFFDRFGRELPVDTLNRCETVADILQEMHS